jgi:hypothetical protein
MTLQEGGILHDRIRRTTAFSRSVDMLGLETRPFPNPLTPAAGITVIDIEGRTHYAESLVDLPPLFQESLTPGSRRSRRSPSRASRTRSGT